MATKTNPADALRASIRTRLTDAALDARTIDAALEALACTYPALTDPIARHPRLLEVREQETRSRLRAAMKARGCSTRDAETAAQVMVDAYVPHVCDLPTRHPRATRNECIAALRAELHPDHRG